MLFSIGNYQLAHDINILVGSHGSGKTRILDRIYAQRMEPIIYLRQEEQTTPYMDISKIKNHIKIFISRKTTKYSWGERKLINILFNTLLHHNTLIILDCPETGLCMEWQEKLLPYLIRNSTNQYIVATNSNIISDLFAKYIIPKQNHKIWSRSDWLKWKFI